MAEKEERNIDYIDHSSKQMLPNNRSNMLSVILIHKNNDNQLNSDLKWIETHCEYVHVYNMF